MSIQSLKVMVVPVGGGTPVLMTTITPMGTSYLLYSTPKFTVPAGKYTITILGTQLSDSTALLDELRLVPA